MTEQPRTLTRERLTAVAGAVNERTSPIASLSRRRHVR